MIGTWLRNLRLDLNKWLLGSGCCTALGVAAGFIYLYSNSADSALMNPQWYQQPLLLIFTCMLLLALVLNVFAVFGVEFHRKPRLATLTEPAIQHNFSRLALQFLQQQSAEKLQGVDNYYLKAEYGVLYYLQSPSDGPLDIIQLRQIFQQMLRHQCHSALAIVPERLDSPAQIFALEANIRVLDAQQLRNWIKA